MALELTDCRPDHTAIDSANVEGREPVRQAIEDRGSVSIDATAPGLLPVTLLAPAAPPATQPPRTPKAPAVEPTTPGRRLAMLRHQPVRWDLIRSRRRTIGFQIDQRGLRVSAPRWVTVWEIERALQEKADWILRKLAEWEQHERRRRDMTPSWEHGSTIRILGEVCTIDLAADVEGVTRVGQCLRVGLPADASSEQIQDMAEKWFRNEARSIFADRIPIYSARLGKSPSRWTLSSARTRWGSCNPDGSIRLNWRLVHFPIDVIDYVIAHELAHLVELNHSPRFWAIVEQLFPDYQRIRGTLRHHYDDLPAS